MKIKWVEVSVFPYAIHQYKLNSCSVHVDCTFQSCTRKENIGPIRRIPRGQDLPFFRGGGERETCALLYQIVYYSLLLFSSSYNHVGWSRWRLWNKDSVAAYKAAPLIQVHLPLLQFSASQGCLSLAHSSRVLNLPGILLDCYICIPATLCLKNGGVLGYSWMGYCVCM